MAIDQLIKDGENYYYVDINGVMAANQWVAIENENAGEDDEGKMLWGWVKEDDPTHIDDTEGDAFKEGDYYFGSSDDGSMTVGWIQLDITYDETESNDDYKYTAAAFTDDEDQTRWFYFKSNGKKIQADSSNAERTKDKTINGKKYAFDEYGAMVAEWSLYEDDLKKNGTGYKDGVTATTSTALLATNSDGVAVNKGNGSNAKYSQSWKYFNSVEDGSRVSKGWFKVVAAEYLNAGKYDDDEDAWYYADGSGNLYAGEFKTIKGKKYAFRNDGRMIDGLKFIKDYSKLAKSDPAYDEQSLSVVADDDSSNPFDNEDDFLENATTYFEKNGYKCYYFGGGDDGAMRSGKVTVGLDGENKNFYFEKSGGSKGAGRTGEKDDKIYQSGLLLQAGSDEKYQVVKKTTHYVKDRKDGKVSYVTYEKLDDAEAFMKATNVSANDAIKGATGSTKVDIGDISKNADDLKEAYTITFAKKADSDTISYDYVLVNTSGKIVDKKGKSKDGNDYYYVTTSKGVITGIYVED